MTVVVGARSLVKADACVVHALLQSRYYDASKGEFLSEDPVFWGRQNIPDPQSPTSWRTTVNASNSAYANTQQRDNPTSGWSDAYIRDPQAQNSYGYSRDNPVRYSDPDGLWYKELLTGQQSWSSFQGELNGAAAQLGADSPSWNYAFGHPVVAGAAVGIGSGLGASEAAGGVVLGSAFNPTLAITGLINGYGWGQTTQAYLQYNATASRTSGGQVVFDSLVFGGTLLGTSQQKAGLNLLSAALTVLQGVIEQQQKAQSSGSASKK